MTNHKNGRNKIWILYFLVIFGFSSYIIFSDYGLLKFFKLKNEISSIQQEINDTEQKLIDLDKEIDSLKSNMVKIEKVARERYFMLRENEKAFVIEKN